uniref:Uncharacterized protein n=1 Tax=Trichogramma kaykai TaxID=54128 RepID=A0ABD2WE50_9HYME
MNTGWLDWFNKERHHHLDQLYSLISEWRGQLPNLRDIFPKKKIEFLLTESIKCMYENPHDDRGQRFIEFVARSGYKDEPDVDENGKQLPRRTTALHRVKMSLDSRGRDAARELFKIYNRFDVNYTNESGLTHLHVACRYGFDDIVEKFFELGQNPECPVDVKGNSPQYFRAVDTRCIKSLPKSKRGNRENSAETLFDTRDKKHQLVQINDLDERGKTPLHWAAYRKNKKIIELLLRNGADPNLATKYDAMTPLHIICRKKRDEDLVELFFKICHEINQPVRVNVCESYGWNTPLHLASHHDRNNKVFELLMSNGANPYLYNSYDETPLHLCLRQGYVEMTRIIFMFNGEVDQPFPRSGETPLQWAVKNSKVEQKNC